MSYCTVANDYELDKIYHDTEWGIPVYDDQKQFEFLMMEVMQCGLNWRMMLNKREIFRECFANFDYNEVANFGDSDIERIMDTPGMIRSRRKIEAVISNAQRFIEVRREFGTFSEFLWAFTEGKTALYINHEKGIIPASNGLSTKVSKILKKRGFKYLGPVTVYSHMQAAGMINDHSHDCVRYELINSNYPTIEMPCDDEQGGVDFSE